MTSKLEHRIARLSVFLNSISKHVFVKQGQISMGVQVDIKGKMNEISCVEKRIGVLHMCLGL